MAVEDVVVALGGRAGPDVRERVAELLHVVEVAEQDLVVDRRAEVARPEEVRRVQVGDVHAARVRRRCLGAVLLEMGKVNSMLCYLCWISNDRPWWCFTHTTENREG